jgi:hypothetical protein
MLVLDPAAGIGRTWFSLVSHHGSDSNRERRADLHTRERHPARPLSLDFTLRTVRIRAAFGMALYKRAKTYSGTDCALA